MMDSKDRKEVRMQEVGEMEAGGGTLSHSVTNDGGRSKPFYIWEDLMMQIRPDTQSEATREAP